MHIPDGFVCASVNIGTGILAALAVGYGLRRVAADIRSYPARLPLVATTAAFIFAAQMLNFPIGGGTSGHFLGAATAAALLGPWAACVVMALVLVIQAFGFADGGLTALGSNVFNMGVIGGLGGYLLLRFFRLLLPQRRDSFIIAASAASWFSVVFASSACAFELSSSGTSPLVVALPAMAGVHAVIGIGEAFICAAALTTVALARPDLLPDWSGMATESALPAQEAVRSGRRIWGLAGAGLALALILGAFVSQFASGDPDGLEKVAQEHGFFASAEGNEVWSGAPLPDYSVPGVAHEGVSTGLAGFAGTGAVFLLGYALIRAFVPREPSHGA